MANQFNIQAYVRPGRVEAPENSYPSNPIKYVSRQMIANRPKGASRWIEEETYSAALTPQQAKEIQKGTSWIQHDLLAPPQDYQSTLRREKIDHATQDYARWLWGLQATDKPRFEFHLRKAPLAVKRCLEQLGYTPSKHDLQQANRVVGESTISGPWRILNQNRTAQYKSVQEHTNALLTKQDLGVTARQIELMEEDQRRDPNASSAFGTIREERIAEIDGKKSYQAGSKKYITRNRLMHKNLPRRQTLLEQPTTVPVDLLAEYQVLKKRSMEAKLRDVMGPGAASLLQENFTRLAQTQCYSLRIIQDLLTLTRQLMEQKRQPTALTEEDAKREAFVDEKRYKELWLAYGFLGEKAELAVTSVSMHTVKFKTSEQNCLELTRDLEYEWPLTKPQTARKQLVYNRIGGWRVPEEKKGKLGNTKVLLSQAKDIRAKYMAKWKPYQTNANKPSTTASTTTHTTQNQGESNGSVY